MALKRTMDVKPGPPITAEARAPSVKIDFTKEDAEIAREDAELDPTETAVAIRDELLDVALLVKTVVTETGEFMMAQRHPNQRPKLRTAFSPAAPSPDAGVAVRIAYEVNRLGALREALAKEG
jgi:hypothetical protein